MESFSHSRPVLTHNNGTLDAQDLYVQLPSLGVSLDTHFTYLLWMEGVE